MATARRSRVAAGDECGPPGEPPVALVGRLAVIGAGAIFSVSPGSPAAASAGVASRKRWWDRESLRSPLDLRTVMKVKLDCGRLVPGVPSERSSNTGTRRRRDVLAALIRRLAMAQTTTDHQTIRTFGVRRTTEVAELRRAGVLIAVTKTAPGKPPSFNRISRSLRSKLTEAIPRRPPAGWRRRRPGPSGPHRSWPLPAASRRAAWPHRPSRALRPSASGCRSG